MKSFSDIFLVGEHKNSLGDSAKVLKEVLANPHRLPELYACITNSDPWVRMRAIDTLEKVLRLHPNWADPYVENMLTRLTRSEQPSVQWHLAQIFGYIKLTDLQTKQAIDWMTRLLSSTKIDWIVAANTMNTLCKYADSSYISKRKLISLLNTQREHKSSAVITRAEKLLLQIS